MNFATQEFLKNIATLDFLGRSFLENVAAGLVVMFLEVVLVVFLLGRLMERHARKKWNGTRQSLAHVLLIGMRRVLENSSKLLEKHDNRIMLNSDIELNLVTLKSAVSNINVEMLVHLPAILPPLSRALSQLTVRISALEETVIALDFLHSKIRSSVEIGTYNSTVPNEMRIDSANFNRDKIEKNMRLAEKAERSNINYFVLTVFQNIASTRRLLESVDRLADDYGGDWLALPDIQDDKSKRHRIVQDVEDLRTLLAGKLEDLEDIEQKIEEDGLYLVYFKPFAERTYPSPGADFDQRDVRLALSSAKA